MEGYRADELIISVRNPKASGSQPYEPDMSTQTDAKDRDTAVELKSTDPNASLVGTTWSGTRAETGEYTIEFLKDGVLHYIISVLQNGVTSPRTVKGTWKQSGENVQIVIGNSYSVMQGTIEGNIMKGEGNNQEGVSWKWTLFKKSKP